MLLERSTDCISSSRLALPHPGDYQLPAGRSNLAAGTAGVPEATELTACRATTPGNRCNRAGPERATETAPMPRRVLARRPRSCSWRWPARARRLPLPPPETPTDGQGVDADHVRLSAPCGGARGRRDNHHREHQQPAWRATCASPARSPPAAAPGTAQVYAHTGDYLNITQQVGNDLSSRCS